MVDWNCKHTWRRSFVNTGWCLFGCSIGDFATIFAFQQFDHDYAVWSVMALAIINGLITSVFLETFILMRQGFSFGSAIDTALKMSFLSMLAMELAMNTVDIFLAGGVLTWGVILPMLTAGFIVPLPYNYYRLKKYGVACH